MRCSLPCCRNRELIMMHLYWCQKSSNKCKGKEMPVVTVPGDVEPESLGIIVPHEHILLDA